MKNIKLFEDFNTAKVLYLHGLDSTPYKDRVDILAQTGAEIIAPQFDYRKEDAASRAAGIIEDRGVTHLIGHSMGGLLAYYMSNRYEIPALMFNPAFGSKNDKLLLDSPTIKAAENMQPNTSQYLVVGMDDDVISPADQIRALDHAIILKIPGMGHSIPPDIFGKYVRIFADMTDI